MTAEEKRDVCEGNSENVEKRMYEKPRLEEMGVIGNLTKDTTFSLILE